MNYLTNKKIIIAIDGFSSCGKSTFAKSIAKKIGYIFIDTGAMYRAVTLFGMQQGAIQAGTVDAEMLVSGLPTLNISFRIDPKSGGSGIYINEQCVDNEIRGIEVSSYVSQVSQIGAVREKLVALQQAMGREKGVVMDGRDIGTVVFPDAELKIFMTADPAIRAQRRYNELLAKGDEVSLAEIEKNIRERDHADQNRTISPLTKAEDAKELDNSYMTIPEQMEWVMAQLEALGAISRA